MKWFFTGRRRAPPVHPPAPEPHDAGLHAATELVDSLYAPANAAAVLAAVTAAGFSASAYYQANPGLQSVFPNPHRAALHFLAMQNERRPFPIQLDLAGCRDIVALPTSDRRLIADLLASLADAAVRMGHPPRLQALRDLWPLLAPLRPLGARPYLIIGDSHSTFYRRSTLRGLDWLLPLNICCSGGSAMGLANPASRSGYGRELRGLPALLAELETGPELQILFQFGQVDVEFVYPFRRLERAEKIFDEQDAEVFRGASVQAYLGFLCEIFPPAARHRVTLLGLFPPALGDGPLRAGYVNGHIANLEGQKPDEAALKAALATLEWPDLAARTAHNAAYNALLRDAAAAAGFGYVEDFEALLGAAGTVDERHIVYGKGENHHLDMIPTGPLLSATLWRLVDPADTGIRISFDDVSELPDPALLPPLDRPGLDIAGLTPDQRAWIDDGVLIKRGFLPPELLDPYIARRAAFRPGTAWNATGWSEGSCYETIPELRAVALHPPLMALLQSLIGEPMLFHLALTGWLSTERAWHQDDYLNPPFVNTWYAAVWIALDTVTPESGPFEYVPGSHRWPLLRGEKVRGFLTDEELARKAGADARNEWPKYSERFLAPAIEEKIAQSGLPVLPFLAEKGDILIWHSRLMHRGAKRVEAWRSDGDKVYPRYPRKALITHYSGIGHRPDMARRETESGGSYAVFTPEPALKPAPTPAPAG